LELTFSNFFNGVIVMSIIDQESVNTIPFHPLADLFPLTQGADFDDLVADIRANGQIEPIILFEDKILDGRNRYLACIAAGVEPKVAPFSKDDPLAFVISANLRRRHLDESQRAMVAAKLATLQRGDNQHSPIGETSQAKAAELLNVGKRSVERARQVREGGTPELAAAVERGDVSVSAAAAVTELPRDVQAEVVAAGPQAVQSAARDIRTNKIGVLSSLTNEHYTPARYVEAARAVLGGIDLDPASCVQANGVVKATTFYTKDVNGLEQPWSGRVWMNPPYGGEAGPFVKKFCDLYAAKRVDAGIILVSSSCTETLWFRLLWDGVLCFTNHRIQFYGDEGNRGQPTTGSIFVYFGPNPDRFVDVFGRFGTCTARVVVDPQIGMALAAQYPDGKGWADTVTATLVPEDEDPFHIPAALVRTRAGVSS
jgi:ParB-like chromosome segregation protein Spo0J